MDEALSYESFLEGAKKAAHRAMDDHGRKEYDEFALHAGIAVERLAKAVLVSKNPMFLVEMRNGNTDMLLHFGGALEIDTNKVRTIGAKEAIVRLRRMKILSLDLQLDYLIDLRNGTAHTTGDEGAKDMIPVFAHTIEELASDLGVDLSKFWGRWARALTIAVTEQEDEILRDVQIRIAQARHAFDDRFVGLPPEIREHAIHAPQHRTSEPWARPMHVKSRGDLIFITMAKECPACSGQALFTLLPGESTSESVTFVAEGVGCYVCDLELSGTKAMTALRRIAGDEAVPTLIIPRGSAAPESDDVRIVDLSAG